MLSAFWKLLQGSLLLILRIGGRGRGAGGMVHVVEKEQLRELLCRIVLRSLISICINYVSFS